ncbi:EAL domain-containing protein [Clostridium sartagoforme]|jgi:EAL domain-containing protein (putative c-di-GMP-specific phosphodiesterase class I)|uniref:EAL domain-containing protein n=1 Tax=Clostridium sartagoforme TaxID=84031 RepID=UPI0031E0C9CE
MWVRIISEVVIFILIVVAIKYILKFVNRKNSKNSIEKSLNKALEKGEFEIYLQPKYNSESDSIVGAEALARWNNRNDGIVSPEVFIPILEKNKNIVKLDMYMFEEACKIINRWSKNNVSLVPISINISKITMSENDNFVIDLKNIIKKYDIDTRFLEIELTERIMFRETNKIVSIIKEIKKIGIKVSLDDFGAGYSSLNILKNIPIDIIKLDKLFLDKRDISEKGKIVIKNIINMANELGLEVVAEGVEFLEQSQFLKSVGCEVVQGYLYGKPMTIGEFEKLEISNRDQYIESIS